MRYLGMLLLTICAAQAVAQRQPLPQVTGILVGQSMNVDETEYRMTTVALERYFLRHATVQLGIGLRCMSHPRNPTYRRLDTGIFTEFRYYLMLRRGHEMSGLYFGLFGDANRLRWIYRAENQTALRKSFFDMGPSAGYQHAIGRYIRFNLGIMAGYRTTAEEIQYAPNGSIDFVYLNWDPWVAMWYARLGVVF